jgi:hypothetical protein
MMKRLTAESNRMGRSYIKTSSPLKDCVAIPIIARASAPLSFRPQGEILDPSHPFGIDNPVSSHCGKASDGRAR